MTEKTIDLDQHRGMTAQKATDLRRLLAEVEANERALRQRRDELEAHLGRTTRETPTAEARRSPAPQRRIMLAMNGVRVATIGIGGRLTTPPLPHHLGRNHDARTAPQAPGRAAGTV
jgi:hypothetical protein